MMKRAVRYVQNFRAQNEMDGKEILYEYVMF
jgi:hypothetical protein